MNQLRHLISSIVLVTSFPIFSWGATTNVGAQAKVAPGIMLTTVTSLSLGTLLINTPGLAGFYEVVAADGSEVTSNATQFGAYSRGEFTISGRSGLNVSLSMVDSPLTCDLTYLNPCIGTPTLAYLTETFTVTGQISNANCTGVRCTDTVFIGGRIGFAGNEAGRWAGDILVTANYQ